MRIAICRIALGEARGIAEASRIEERMRLIDPRVDVADLNAAPAVALPPAAFQAPAALMIL